ncbi:MAG: hypothetical protein K2N48_00315 [Muribaculaceae bacterium]|nr:hypothetical protein [Muribaculaceae bacterium]
MGAKNFITLLLALVAIPSTAQIFNFSLRTNNQQLIDKALSGAFVRINQSYELCDTVKDEHFGRDGKDYFNIVPFIGVETEAGIVFPSSALTPWANDNDFDKYKDRYKPLATKSTISLLNIGEEQAPEYSGSPLEGHTITKYLCTIADTTQTKKGLNVDSISGRKDGWFIWLSSEHDLAETDTVKLTSIKKDLEVPVNGECIRIDSPEISETVYGGIYVTPTQTAVGQITFTLTGIMVSDEEGWFLDFPFIAERTENKPLTPIKGITDEKKLNPLKAKKKK